MGPDARTPQGLQRTDPLSMPLAARSLGDRGQSLAGEPAVRGGTSGSVLRLCLSYVIYKPRFMTPRRPVLRLNDHSLRHSGSHAGGAHAGEGNHQASCTPATVLGWATVSPLVVAVSGGQSASRSCEHHALSPLGGQAGGLSPTPASAVEPLEPALSTLLSSPSQDGEQSELAETGDRPPHAGCLPPPWPGFSPAKPRACEPPRPRPQPGFLRQAL